MCCDPSGFAEEEIDGECPDCENPTVEGAAFDRCAWSPEDCETCGHAYCDLSC